MSTDNVNISDMALLDEPVDYNPDAVPTSTKVPDGTYLMELSLGKFGVKPKATKANKAYVEAHVQGKVIAPGTKFDGFRVSGFLTSLEFADETSAIQQMLRICGNKSRPTTCRELLAEVEDTLNANPQVLTKVRWEARAKDENGSWKRVKGMKNFPTLPDGSHDPEIDIAGEIVEARETIYGFARGGNGATA